MISRKRFDTIAVLGAGILIALAALHHVVSATPTVTAPTALAATQVTTGGTAVTAIAPGAIYNGCYIQNDPNATTNLIIDPVNTASSSSPSSTASFIGPGQSWNCPAANLTAVSIVSSDSAHKFYGVKF